ncbi:unnamed protein product, partial [Discosporangium mesarthrocarpum]
GEDRGGSSQGGASSPLLTATDPTTVRPGMMLASVAPCGGQGVSEAAVHTLGMGVAEVAGVLLRLQHLTRSVAFVDPPPLSSGDAILESGRVAGEGGTWAGVTPPYKVEVEVVEGEDLCRKELLPSDLFVWLRLGGSSQKTTAHKSSSHNTCHWEEVLTFSMLSLEEVLYLQVWDQDSLGATDPLGELSIPLAHFPVNTPSVQETLVTDRWLPLQKTTSGRVHLRVKVDQKLSVKILAKKTESAARVLQGAMRSFMSRKRSTVGLGRCPATAAGVGADRAHRAAALVAQEAQEQGLRSRAVAWESMGAHASSTLADVFPRDEQGVEGYTAPAPGVGSTTRKFLDGPALDRFEAVAGA